MTDRNASRRSAYDGLHPDDAAAARRHVAHNEALVRRDRRPINKPHALGYLNGRVALNIKELRRLQYLDANVPPDGKPARSERWPFNVVV